MLSGALCHLMNATIITPCRLKSPKWNLHKSPREYSSKLFRILPRIRDYKESRVFFAQSQTQLWPDELQRYVFPAPERKVCSVATMTYSLGCAVWLSGVVFLYYESWLIRHQTQILFLFYTVVILKQPLPKCCVKRFLSYFEGWFQKVLLGGSCITPRSLPYGVLQCRTLSPLQLNIYMKTAEWRHHEAWASKASIDTQFSLSLS